MHLPTFADFRRVLLGLGFQDRSVPGSHVLLQHANTDTVILLRPYQDEEELDPATLLGYRRILDEKGVVTLDRFDDLLRQQAVAS
jgi:predicted RNA binding protein YcfA (HicA-like mRNA interferase family)